MKVNIMHYYQIIYKWKIIDLIWTKALVKLLKKLAMEVTVSYQKWTHNSYSIYNFFFICKDRFGFFLNTQSLAGVYLFKVNNGSRRKMYKMCSKLSLKTPERHQWHLFKAFIVNFQYILHIVLVLLLLISNE